MSRILGQQSQQADEPPLEHTLEDAFVDVQGLRIHYVRAGAGRPLVMIHGLTGSTANWTRNIPALADRASVYAVDLPNMGRSSRHHAVDASLSATADRVAAWMDAVGLDQADIAGHSHGGAVAMMFAARHPGRVCSLLLFAPANPYSNLGDGLIRIYSSFLGRQFARFIPFLPRAVHSLALGRMYGDPSRIRPGCLEGYTGGLRVRGTIDHILRILRNWHSEMRALRAAIPHLARVPVLLVWGDRDRAVSLDSGLRLHQELPRSEWCVARGAGHVSFEEMPELCNAVMLRWLDRVDLPSYHAQAIAGARDRKPSRADARSRAQNWTTAAGD